MSAYMITRRTVLRAGVALAGTLAFGELGLQAKTPRAGERPTLVVFWLNGGPAGLFNSADSFLANGAFGVTQDNVRALGNGLYVDAGSLGTLPSSTLARMAAIPFRHGLYSHNDARAAVLEMGSRSQLLRMAAAMPDSAIPCAIVNNLGLPVGVSANPAAEGHVAFEHIEKLDDARRSFSMSEFDAIRHVYGVPSGSIAIDEQRSTFAGVEALIHAGASVIFAQPAYTGRQDRQFDTHKDDVGKVAREVMAPITPSLTAFLSRVMTLPGRNVVTLLTGEFSRTLPESDHAKGGTATVIGKYIKTGSAGRQHPDGSPPEDASKPDGLWAYVAAALRLGELAPFGANPYPERLLGSG
ncbi:hypothetical protein SAMN05216570_3354 [Dyella sp. OK004]|uniref:hypothetical protein n=1 Tax=Dyella sp. OK004 TaxID=1855292 RepID=UPI0008EF80A9|nr:hypothetical protein [Dyella sp. OK004]SFS16659.1 hypothetical protein SAMN05216570_3354 [Dyella sp. OK004]